MVGSHAKAQRRKGRGKGSEFPNSPISESPLLIEELTPEVCWRYKGTLWNVVIELSGRRSQLAGEINGVGTGLDKPEFCEENGLDPYLPAWAVAKFKRMCRGGEVAA